MRGQKDEPDSGSTALKPGPYRAALAVSALVAGLVLPTGLPEIANIGFFVVAGLAMLMLALRADWRRLLVQPAALMPLVAGLLLVTAFAFTAASAMHVVVAGYFMALYLVAPFGAALLAAPRLSGPGPIAIAAGTACVIALGVALYDTLVLGITRAGSSVNNPIHFADLTLTLGFIALVGVHERRLPVRLFALASPIIAIVAVLLSASRGPLVASVPMLGTAFVILAVQFRDRLHPAMVLAALAGLGLMGWAALWQSGLADRLNAFADVATVLGGDAPDSSTAQRLAMLAGAYNAFLASPIFGHGLIGFTDAVALHAPPGSTYVAYDHLHNDIADFAVVGGVMGLAAYALFLLAPLCGALAAPRGPGRAAAIYLAGTGAVGYFSMGLTNAMFGILSQTVLYAVLCALVLRLCQQDRASP